MSINRTVVKEWNCKVVLENGQCGEVTVRAKTIKEAREIAKQDSHVLKVVSVSKPKI